jgi:hypothetical protein
MRGPIPTLVRKVRPLSRYRVNLVIGLVSALLSVVCVLVLQEAQVESATPEMPSLALTSWESLRSEAAATGTSVSTIATPSAFSGAMLTVEQLGLDKRGRPFRLLRPAPPLLKICAGVELPAPLSAGTRDYFGPTATGPLVASALLEYETKAMATQALGQAVAAPTCKHALLTVRGLSFAVTFKTEPSVDPAVVLGASGKVLGNVEFTARIIFERHGRFLHYFVVGGASTSVDEEILGRVVAAVKSNARELQQK